MGAWTRGLWWLLGAGAALIGLTIASLPGAVNQLPSATTTLQRLETWAQLAYSVLGPIALAAAVAASRWTSLLLYAWATALTLAAGLAAIGWGQTGIGQGVLAGAAAAAIAVLVVWMGRRALSARTSAAPKTN